MSSLPRSQPTRALTAFNAPLPHNQRSLTPAPTNLMF
jgi:hypothetical protein